MPKTVIKVENLSKYYRLGTIGGATLREDAQRWWARLRGHPDPTLPVGKETDQDCGREDLWALRDVSFDVAEGQVLGVIGHNGAGKSTLLKVLSRITAPTSGVVKVKGRIGSLLEVGTGFHPELSGRENIFLNGTILGMTRNDVKLKLEEIASFAEIEQFLDTPVKRYSSGMSVRLAFAIAAHLDPEILIVDEVLAVGDAAFQQRCLGKMEVVSKEGRTVIFVSHDMVAIQHLCRRAILLRNGSIVTDGIATDAVDRYLKNHLAPKSTVGAYEVKHMVRTDQSSRFQFTNIELLSLNCEPLRFLFTGDGLIIRIHYEAKDCYKAPVFSVQLHTGLGRELVRLNTRPISGYDIQKIEGQGSIDLVIDSLPFTAGTYYVDIGFAKERQYWICRLENIVRLSVLERDVYGSGMALNQNRGLFTLSHKWHLR